MIQVSRPFIYLRYLTYEQVVIGRQADGNDVGLEVDPLLQSNEREIVGVGEEVVLWVDYLLRHFALDVRVRLRRRGEVPLADAGPDLRDLEAEKEGS